VPVKPDSNYLIIVKPKLPKIKDIKASIGWLKIKQLIPEDYNEKNLIDSTFVNQP